jgi:hypothetical protein
MSCVTDDEQRHLETIFGAFVAATLIVVAPS